MSVVLFFPTSLFVNSQIFILGVSLNMQSTDTMNTVTNMPLQLGADSNQYSHRISPSTLSTPQGLSNGKGASHTFEADRKHVHFSDVLVRRYDLTCTGYVNHGPAIGLDWSFTDVDAVSLDDFEQRRQPRRPRKLLIVGPRQRAKVLITSNACDMEKIQRVCSRRVASRQHCANRLPKNCLPRSASIGHSHDDHRI